MNLIQTLESTPNPAPSLETPSALTPKATDGPAAAAFAQALGEEIERRAEGTSAAAGTSPPTSSPTSSPTSPPTSLPTSPPTPLPLASSAPSTAIPSMDAGNPVAAPSEEAAAAPREASPVKGASDAPGVDTITGGGDTAALVEAWKHLSVAPAHQALPTLPPAPVSSPPGASPTAPLVPAAEIAAPPKQGFAPLAPLVPLAPGAARADPALPTLPTLPVSSQPVSSQPVSSQPGVSQPGVSPPGANPSTPMASPPLRDTPLGSELRLITPEAPDPDLQSLVRFARDNGLDDHALKLLFGPAMTPPSDPVSVPFAPAAALFKSGLRGVATVAQAPTAAPAPDAQQPQWPTGPVWTMSLTTLMAPELSEPELGQILAEPQSPSYDALTQKFGEAIGRRVAAQFNQGLMAVTFALDPARLGPIEVALRLGPDGLEAQLNAQQSITRELLADALPRLREVLAQSGMDVASIQLASTGGHRGGGNPTPRGIKGLRIDESEPTVVGSQNSQAVVRPREEGSGLDLWA